ncbi:MAG: GNAT family N-acetyltransferase [Gemmatimonadetes bacterium]|nr:GNAT family N-acetyltransferase [Gemmatimonadota bacterium]
MSVRFSLAGPADEVLVLSLMREFYELEHLTFVEEPARAALRQILESHTYGSIALIHSGEELAGYLVLTFGFSLEFHGRDALVDELYVREPFRGRGAGTLSLAFVEELCRTEGVHALHLEVDRANESAQRLYHRAGYQDHDRYLLTKWLERE